MKETLSKGKREKPKDMWSSKEKPHMWPAKLLEAPPPKGALIHPCHPKRSWDKAQNNGFPKSNPKSTFTIHDDIFQRPFELKIFMWA
jgi:hypothetical protein